MSNRHFLVVTSTPTRLDDGRWIGLGRGFFLPVGSSTDPTAYTRFLGNCRAEVEANIVMPNREFNPERLPEGSEIAEIPLPGFFSPLGRGPWVISPETIRRGQQERDNPRRR